MSQLVLPIRLEDYAVFETFHGIGNEPLLDHLQQIAAGEVSGGGWIAGPFASGKSHLLQALCERSGDRSVYLSADILKTAGVEMIDGLANRETIAIDDVDALFGEPRWESALFELYNELLARGGNLVVSAGAPQRDTAIELPDLASRMSQLPTFLLHPLADAERISALQLRARHRGLDLPNETAQYLLTRSRRDMNSLYAVLDRLDLESLRAKRRLTVPFVREVLAIEPEEPNEP